MILLPNHLLPSILHLTDEFLDRHEILGIIFDIDNTLVGYHIPEPTDEVKNLLAHLRERGVKLAIASNNKKSRVRRFAANLGMAAYHRSAKPLPFVLRCICKDFNLPKKNIALVGDQIFTDVWGGNWAGVQTVLVEPIDELEKNLFFRIKRALEGPLIIRKKREESK